MPMVLVRDDDTTSRAIGNACSHAERDDRVLAMRTRRASDVRCEQSADAEVIPQISALLVGCLTPCRKTRGTPVWCEVMMTASRVGVRRRLGCPRAQVGTPGQPESRFSQDSDPSTNARIEVMVTRDVERDTKWPTQGLSRSSQGAARPRDCSRGEHDVRTR